jgi:arylsulfatase A-like enzyme
MRVPLMIGWSRNIRPRHEEALVSVPDLMPTLFNTIAGLPLRNSRYIEAEAAPFPKWMGTRRSTEKRAERVPFSDRVCVRAFRKASMPRYS